MCWTNHPFSLSRTLNDASFAPIFFSLNSRYPSRTFFDVVPAQNSSHVSRLSYSLRRNLFKAATSHGQPTKRTGVPFCNSSFTDLCIPDLVGCMYFELQNFHRSISVRATLYSAPSYASLNRTPNTTPPLRIVSIERAVAIPPEAHESITLESNEYPPYDFMYGASSSHLFVTGHTYVQSPQSIQVFSSTTG